MGQAFFWTDAGTGQTDDAVKHDIDINHNKIWLLKIVVVVRVQFLQVQVIPVDEIKDVAGANLVAATAADAADLVDVGDKGWRP